jgi:hypothetical protein
MSEPSLEQTDHPDPPPLRFAPRRAAAPPPRNASADPAGRYYLLAGAAALAVLPAIFWGHMFWALAIVGLAALTVLLAAGIRVDLYRDRPGGRGDLPAGRGERAPSRPGPRAAVPPSNRRELRARPRHSRAAGAPSRRPADSRLSR